MRKIFETLENMREFIQDLEDLEVEAEDLAMSLIKEELILNDDFFIVYYNETADVFVLEF